MSIRKEISRSIRLDPVLAWLAEVTAGVQNKTFSEVAREALWQYVVKRLPFTKSRVKEMIETFQYFEKSDSENYIEKARISMSLYPTGRPLEDYVLFKKAEAAAEELKRRGFEAWFADESALRWFGWIGNNEEKQHFRKSLTSIIQEDDSRKKEQLGEFYRFVRKHVLKLDDNER